MTTNLSIYGGFQGTETSRGERSLTNEVILTGFHTGPEHLRSIASLVVPYSNMLGAEVKNFNPENHFDKPQLDYLDRFAQFALVATREAVADAELRFTKKLAQRTAVVHGTGIGGQNTQEASYHSIYACSAKRVHPFTIPKIMPNAGCSHISIEFGITGPSFTTSTACSSAGHAIGLAYMMLRQGMVDVALSGGGEACITPGTMMGWDSLRVTSNDTCRPFSKNRSGTVIGEGAATLILETLEHALSRDAKIYAEIIGFGMSADAYNIVQPLNCSIGLPTCFI